MDPFNPFATPTKPFADNAARNVPLLKHPQQQPSPLEQGTVVCSSPVAPSLNSSPAHSHNAFFTFAPSPLSRQSQQTGVTGADGTLHGIPSSPFQTPQPCNVHDPFSPFISSARFVPSGQKGDGLFRLHRHGTPHSSGRLAVNATPTNGKKQVPTLPGASPHLWRDRFKKQCADRLKEARREKVNQGREGLRKGGRRKSNEMEGTAPMDNSDNESAKVGTHQRGLSGEEGRNFELRDSDDLWSQQIVRLEWRKFCADNEMAYWRQYGQPLTADVASTMEEEILQEMHQEEPNYFTSDMNYGEDDGGGAYDDYMDHEEADTLAAIAAHENQEMTEIANSDNVNMTMQDNLYLEIAERVLSSNPCFNCKVTGNGFAPTSSDNHAVACRSCGIQLEMNTVGWMGRLLHPHQHRCTGNPLLVYDPSTGLLLMCTTCDLCEVIL